MTDIFCKLLSIKETQTTLQSKETTLQVYRKSSNQNTKKSPRIQVVFFNCTNKMGIYNFSCLNSSLSLFLLCKEPAKKIMVDVCLQWTFLSPHRSKCTFSWITPPLSKLAYFLDDPNNFNN